ncbi:unnamed protein product [Agarophyton chilense]
MATSDGSAAAVAKPCLWTRLSVNHTKKTCLLAYAFPFLSIAIIALSRQFAFDDPNGVDFFIRNDELTRLFDAREAAREQYAFGASASVVERATERPEFHLNVLFRGKLPPQFEKLPSNADEKQTASNVLTRNNLALLKQIEDDILGTAEYPSYCYFDETAKDCAGRNLACAHPLSLTNSPFLYGIWEEGRLCGRRNTSEPPAEERFASFLNSLVDTDSEGNAVVNAAYKEFVGKEFSRTESGSERGSGSSNHSSSSNMPFYFKFLPGKWQKKNDTAGLHYSFLERFFGGIWTKLIYRGRYALVVLALVLAGLGVYGATKLEPIQETEQFLPSDHPLRVLQTTLADGFGEERRAVTLQARVTWGISDIDRSGTSRFQPESIGRAVLDERFDLRRKEVQEQVRRACGWFVRREGLVTQQAAMEEAVDCWVSDYEQWRKQELKKDGLESFETHAQLAEELKRFGAFEAADNSRPYERYIKSQAIGFSAQQERVVFTEIRFVTGKKPALTAKFMRPIYNEWKAATEGLNAIGPEASGDRGAFVTSGVAGNVEGGINVWSWMRSQETLVISMFSGVGIMVGVALVTLTVCTMNWAVSLIATVCIGGLVSMLLGVMHAVGWELGTTETIAVVISIGYGFDGVAHMATAYVECGKEGRVERTRHALLTLGVSIWFGALSTLTSAVVLFAAMITFFVKFGGLLVCTVLLSAMWSLVLLPAVLMVVGPQGATGSVRAVVAAAVGTAAAPRRAAWGRPAGGGRRATWRRSAARSAR